MKFRSCLLTGLSAFALSPFSAPLLRAAEWELSGSLIAHDPTLVKEGDTFWCFYTGKGLPYKTSADGRAWTLHPRFFEKELSWWRDYAPAMDKVDVWAPDLHRFGQRYWLYYSVSEFGKNNSAIGLMSCSSLAKGDWKDEGLVIGSKHERDAYNAIDPNLTVDAEGKPWLVFGSWFSGIQIVQLDPGTMKPTGPVRAIAAREKGVEGGCLVLRDGYYYLFASIDRCCQGVKSDYKICVGRSRSITGPFIDRSGTDMIQGGGTVIEVGGDRYKGPGGQNVDRIGDAWVIARHSYDTELKGEPVLRLADLYWDAEGWPSLTEAKAR